jgi:hypothetical protein
VVPAAYPMHRMGYAANLCVWALFHESQWRWAKTCGTVAFSFGAYPTPPVSAPQDYGTPLIDLI